MITAVIAAVLTTLGIYGFAQYGVALFFIIPFLMGMASAIIYGIGTEITWRDAWITGFISLGIYAIVLIAFAIEGIICIIMASPIALVIALLGSSIGYQIVKKKPGSGPMAIILVILSFPATSFVEKNIGPSLSEVTTSIEINASPEAIWKNVIAFPKLEEPTDFIFQTGIAYPTDATIEGSGVGAVRHCNFSTGSFVEPITVWDELKLLKFDVEQQPAPMKELSFWNIDAPHLHDFFVSQQGQFKLTALPNGHTLLEGTTWYRHDIRPEFYWKIWSDMIVHKIHERVLQHIKKNSEQ